MKDKNELRKWAKNERRLRDKRVDELLAEKLIKSGVFKTAQNIMLYYPLEDEINLLSVLKVQNKNFYLPKIDGEKLLCCKYSLGDSTCFSKFNTKEPLTPPCPKGEIDLAVIPALCCDVNNYRLGYGGGYYDKFLRDFNGKTIVCLPSGLVVETVFPEPHDIKADIVLTV